MKNLFNSKGLTLIEIIVTLALLGIIISPVMGFFIYSQKINNESETEYKSIQLAQKYMEEIKSMDKIDLNIYKDDDLDGTFNRTVNEDNYTVNIELEPVSNNIVSDETIIYDATLKIGGTDSNDEDVYWNDIPYPNIIEDDKLDLAIKQSNIILGGKKLTTTAMKIKVIFNTGATLNIINSSRIVELYVENNNNNWQINVEEGFIPKIFNTKEEVANNILYDITVNVTKGTRTITVDGTKIFK